MAGRNCPYCRFPIKEGGRIYECGNCRAVHHEDCWADNGGCAITSCAGGPSAHPTAVTASPVAAYPPPPPAGTYGHPTPPPGKTPAGGPPYPAPVGPPPPAAPDLGVAAAQFVGQVQTHLRLPGMRAAGVAAGFATLAMIAAGLALTLLFPDTSLVGLVGQHASAITGMFRQGVQELQGPFGGQRAGPVLLVLIPIGACALFTLKQQRTLEADAGARLAWGAAVGVPFGFLMLLVAVVAGNPNAGGEGGPFLGDAGVGSALLLGLLWGATGGLIGAWVGLRRLGWRVTRWPVGHPVQRAAALAGASLRPFVAALVVATVVGTGYWTVEAVRGKGFVREELNLGGSTRASLPSAVAQTLLYSGDHGLHALELGTGTKFAGYLTPLPVDHPEKIYGATGANVKPRIFDYRRGMAAYIFIPLLVLLIAIPAIFALYAGFSTARTQSRPSRAYAAAWGALVGPVWALAAVILNALVQKQIPASAIGDSVFVTFLLGGAALGALGGLLAHERPAGGPAGFPQGAVQ